MSKLWHDDIRKAPDDSWLWARTNTEAIEILRNNEITEASLDHDMGMHEMNADDPNAEVFFPGNWSEEEGTDLVKQMIAEDLVPPVITIHSHNPVGARRMANLLRDVGVEVVIKPYIYR